MTRRWWAALAGAVAGLGGLTAADLTSALLHNRVSPVLAVGETVIALTPGSVAERAIAAVGRADKPLLVTGVVLAVVVLSALAGVLMVRHQGLGTTLLAALPMVAVAALLTRPDAQPAGALPAVAGGVVGLVLALRLVPLATRVGTTDAETGRVQTRRRFLTVVAVTAVAAAGLEGIGRWLGGARRAVEEARQRTPLRLSAPTVPAGTDLGVPGVASWVTPAPDFYRIDTALAPPLLTPARWELRIHGMVAREVRLSYEDLLARGLESAWITLCCVSNQVGGNLISNARWTGVRIDELLAEAGPTADADALLSTSQDGWTCGTPLSALTDGRNALLAVALNGEPLPVEHGFPVRMVVPGLYGFVSATKWVVDWEVTRFDRFDAYWTQRGWAEQSEIKTQSRIDTPRGSAHLRSGTVTIGGVAWAQHRGIRGVEVRVDDGEWQEATLAREPTTDTWVQWLWRWPATAGPHTLTVRATDADGVTQPEQRTDVIPDGATGWHSVDVDVSG